MSPSSAGVLFGLICLGLAVLGHRDFYFKGFHGGNLLEAHETVPRKVSLQGEHISHNLTSFHEDGQVHFNVSIQKDKHRLLVLHEAAGILAPGIVIERRKRDVHERYQPKDRSKNCHFKGVVHGEENSRVAVSACNGLTGIIHGEDGIYYIEPKHHRFSQVPPGHPHLVYRKSSATGGKVFQKRRRKKRRAQSSCGTKEPKRLTELEWQRQLGKVKVQEKKHKHAHKLRRPNREQSILKKQYYKKTSRKTRSISQPHYVETLLVADSSMVEFHQDREIETYLLTIMNMVSSFYTDPSIGNFVNVVVVKIILIDDPGAEPDLNVTHNADQTLRNFCKWQKGLNPLNDSHPHHHDVAILMTRKDICARGDFPCNTLGVAHIGGMCKSGRSCSVNEDNGIISAHTIAHEMGHNFGMLHDTDKTGCRGRLGNVLHIMTPSFEHDAGTVSWSECSKNHITHFLDKGMGSCLEDEPSFEEVYEYPELPSGAMYNADDQCQFQFGEDAKVCSPLDEICTRLWCTMNDTCITELRPAAPGTHCGWHKWCEDQKCVPIMDAPKPIDGGWGEWGPWSPCSRTCGSGVSIMQRECDHPKPAAGGRFCVGERRRYRICSSDPCPKNQPTFRALQCSQHNNRTHEGKTYEWQPYFDKDEPCKLYCSDANETVIVAWGEYVADGTSCSVIARDVCISGICKRVGCDWVVDSTAKEDDCGICQGDGTKCDKFHGVYSKQSHSPGYREVVVIPPHARNIRIQEKDRSENYLGIGSALKKKFYLNGKHHITLPGEYTVAGAQALYERENQLEKIRIPGPILEPIVVYIIFRGKTYNPGVTYNYSMWKPETQKQVKYSWILDDWSQCSSTCGGGVQQRQPLCQESTVSSVASELERPTVVDELMCEPSERPQLQMRTCNDNPCPYYWWVGPWQSCPTCAHKGKKSLQFRNVMCIDGNVTAIHDSFCDQKAKPIESQLCKHALPQCEDIEEHR